jgi:hypothetical protein
MSTAPLQDASVITFLEVVTLGVAMFGGRYGTGRQRLLLSASATLTAAAVTLFSSSREKSTAYAAPSSIKNPKIVIVGGGTGGM